MSISGEKRARFLPAEKWAAASGFCFFFSAVYNHFGHGVRSPFMDLLFLWPLAGAAVWLIFALRRFDPPESLRRTLYCALFTGAVGSLLQGIVEIAGTDCPAITLFFAASAVWFAAFLFFAVRKAAFRARTAIASCGAGSKN